MKKLLNALSFTTLLVSCDSDDSPEDSMKFSEMNKGGWTALDGSAQIHIESNGEALDWIIHEWDGACFLSKALDWEMTSNTSEHMEGKLKIEDVSVPIKFVRSGENLKVQMFWSNEPLLIEFDKWEQRYSVAR